MKIMTRSLLSAAVSTVVAFSAPSSAVANEASPFFADSSISGSVNFFLRDRDRAGTDANGKDTSKASNLDHGSAFANLSFQSGYINDFVGLDAMVYATYDMWQDASPDHEMNFWNVDNPYDKNPEDAKCTNIWTDCNVNGASIGTAALKFKLGENSTAKLGYFQPSVPSTLGVNWSFAPGTYRGGEIGTQFGGVSLGLVVADQYKAPWYKNDYEFRTTLNKDAGEVYSTGARYTLENGIALDVGYGALTDGDRKNAHIKLKGETAGGVNWSPQLYVTSDDEKYDSTAFQLALLTSMSSGQYSYRAEATYTSAESKVKGVSENFTYRLTTQFGGSNGAYDIWWNNRSDFNHDEELAFFLSASRDFSDIDAPGFSAGISGAYGFGSKATGYDDLKEYAYSLFANYSIQNGALKGANIGLHFTQYFNDTDATAWNGYTNLFQDETDFKLILSMPFSIKQ
ncbi:hypothetical protein [Endozoicomonas arenosclerae]|uniref:hypothetical protein n=1 Tax=Endozoicomonas arenosclerae TaxID=1633495 RepID=UPI00078256A7|nr:hypothetical protein [Endozoicomonas arenosclerae]